MNLKGIKLTWLGHSTFRIETPAGKTVIIDPWIMGNPMCPESEKKVKKVDVLLCTHGHGDHIGDAVEVVKQHNPLVIGIYELCLWLGKKGAKQISPMVDTAVACEESDQLPAERRTDRRRLDQARDVRELRRVHRRRAADDNAAAARPHFQAGRLPHQRLDRSLTPCSA